MFAIFTATSCACGDSRRSAAPRVAALTLALALGGPAAGVAHAAAPSDAAGAIAGFGLPLDAGRLAAGRGDVSIAAPAAHALLRATTGFEANRGQADRRARFLARGPGFNLFLAPSGVRLGLYDAAGRAGRLSSVGLRFVGAATPTIAPEHRLPGKVNYLIGRDRSRWQTNVPTFQRVRYRRVWAGIDALFYGSQRRLEYDFVVAPGADPAAIGVRFDGARRPRVDARGDLVLGLKRGSVRQLRPIAYQVVDGRRRRIASRYAVSEDGVVGVRVGRYDRRRELVIDPVLAYSTFFTPGSGGEGWEVTTDSAGSAYITGWMTGGSLNSSNVYVAKFNPAGTALEYFTYFGGVVMEEGHDIVVDDDGYAYVVGRTNSGDFPTTAGALQPQIGGGRDAFVAKIDPTGSGLAYCTFLGGAADDTGEGIDLDPSGRAHVTGWTASSGFPTTAGAPDRTLSGASDAFVARLDADGGALSYSTLLGGGADDSGAAIAVAATGVTYVAGATSSADFPTTAGAPQRAYRGAGDAFVARVNAAGTTMTHSTYLGGSGSDGAGGIAIDPGGAAVVAGSTASADFPVTGGVVQPGFGGVADGFVTKLDSSGTALTYSTYLGGSASDSANGVALNAAGEAHVSGETSSSNFPVSNPVQTARAGQADAFVTRLDAAGASLVYSTFLGGTTIDGSSGIALDSQGIAYVVGTTRSADFPVVNAWQPTVVDGIHAFLAKFDGTDATAPQTSLLSGPPVESSSNAATFTFATSEPGPGSTFECRLDGAAFAPCTSPAVLTALAQGSHTFRIRAIDAANNIDPSPASYAWNVDATPPDTVIDAGPPPVTNATTAVFEFTGGVTYECRLDGGAFLACSSPKSYDSLAEGAHTFAVRASDAAGNTDVSPATRAWSIDRVPPDTSIDSAPISPSTETAAVFAFSSTKGGSTFECRLDAAPYAACASPLSLTGLAEGEHTFRVRAKDPAGNTDPSEATHGWRIETAPPQTTIRSGPAAMSASGTAAFELEANEPASFECSIDAHAFEACTSPTTYAALAEGDHTFQARATDLSNKVGSPAAWPWTIDLTPPSEVAQLAPAGAAANLPASPPFSWAPATDARTGVDHYELWLDGDARRTLSPLLCGPATCATVAPAPLADGPHSWHVRAVDGAGNASVSATRSFTVDALAPLPFALASPGDGAMVATRRPALSWHAATDAGIGVASYDVLIDGQVAAAAIPASVTTFVPAANLADGDHRWRVVARDGYGNERASDEQRFTVDVTPPLATFTAAPNPALAGRTVTFDASASSDPDSGIVRFEWDLDGDGVFERDTGAGATTAYSFGEPGTFAVQLRVTNRAGMSATARLDQRITADSRNRGQVAITINDGARFTNSPSVVITATWPAFANQMLISNDGGFKQPRSFGLHAETPWVLDSSGPERLSKIVYVRFTRGSTVSETYIDDIILDERSPVVSAASVVTRKGASAPLLRVRARDRGAAGVSSVQITNNRRAPHAKFRAHRAMIKLIKRSGERRVSVRKTIYVRVRDRAGNVSAWHVARRRR